MRHTFIVFVALFCLFGVSSCDKSQQQVLMENLSLPKENHPEWSELFTHNFAVTRLETTPDCIIGMIDKIKKFKNEYYIASSTKSVFRFNGDGKFVMSLDKMGQGPEEYIRVEDFDVYEINGKVEIWISDNESLKVYDADNGVFIREMNFPFVIHKFKRMKNGHILLVTGQKDHSLTLTDERGEVISEYLGKEIPYLMFRAVQFVEYNNKYLFQLGISNAYVAFDSETETFNRGIYSKENVFLTDKQLLEMFRAFGIDFIREANNRSYLSNITPLGNKVWCQIRHANKNYLSKISERDMVSTEFSYGTFLSTISIGESENSLLLYLQPDQLLESGKTLIDKSGVEIQCQLDDNPIIVEFFQD